MKKVVISLLAVVLIAVAVLGALGYQQWNILNDSRAVFNERRAVQSTTIAEMNEKAPELQAVFASDEWSNFEKEHADTVVAADASVIETTEAAASKVWIPPFSVEARQLASVAKEDASTYGSLVPQMVAKEVYVNLCENPELLTTSQQNSDIVQDSIGSLDLSPETAKEMTPVVSLISNTVFSSCF